MMDKCMVSVRLLWFHVLNETVGFQVLIAVAMKSSVFSNIIYHLYLQGHGIICQACSAFCSLQVGFLLGLLFDTQEGSNMFLSNVD
jgi:hypothetical protein